MSARPRTEAAGGDALCNQLNRLPKEIFEMLMDVILNNSSVDACQMVQYINWQGAGVTHMDLSKDATWVELMLRIFNDVPYGRCVTADDRWKLEKRLDMMTDELRLQDNWMQRFNFVCRTLRSYKTPLDKWIERAKTNPGSIKGVSDHSGRLGYIVENPVPPPSTLFRILAADFSVFAKTISQQEICHAYQSCLVSRNFCRETQALLDAKQLETHEFENELRKVMRKAVPDSTDVPGPVPVPKAMGAQYRALLIERENLEARLRRWRILLPADARNLKAKIANYKRAWDEEPAFAPEAPDAQPDA